MNYVWRKRRNWCRVGKPLVMLVSATWAERLAGGCTHRDAAATLLPGKTVESKVRRLLNGPGEVCQ